MVGGRERGLLEGLRTKRVANSTHKTAVILNATQWSEESDAL